MQVLHNANNTFSVRLFEGSRGSTRKILLFETVSRVKLSSYLYTQNASREREFQRELYSRRIRTRFPVGRVEPVEMLAKDVTVVVKDDVTLHTEHTVVLGNI